VQIYLRADTAIFLLVQAEKFIDLVLLYLVRGWIYFIFQVDSEHVLEDLVRCVLCDRFCIVGSLLYEVLMPLVLFYITDQWLHIFDKIICDHVLQRCRASTQLLLLRVGRDEFARIVGRRRTFTNWYILF